MRSGTNVARSGLQIGRDAVLNQLLVTNGARLISYGGYIGFGSISQSNVAVISGPGSVWDSGNDFDFGGGGTFNQVIVSNSGAIFDSDAIIGNGGGSSNTMSVIGPGSVWSNASLSVYGSFNQLTVSGGGHVSSGSSLIDGTIASGSHNTVFLDQPGSFWDAGTLYVGSSASFNQLVVSNFAKVLASEFYVGYDPTSTNNRVVLGGGTLQVTNALFTAPFDIRRGTNQFNSGLIVVDRLLMTNRLAIFEFNGGALNVRTSTVSNARVFFVGDGANPATLNLVGNGIHSFAGGLTVRSNASLIGNGTISGTLSLLPGGSLSPGSSVGKFVFNSPPFLQGTVLMEISKNGTTLTNDQVQAIGSVTYGGTLIVTNIGPSALSAGDRFVLFPASSYFSSFAAIILPPLDAGLMWFDGLRMDGSIQVISAPYFTSISASGSNLLIEGTNGPINGTYRVLVSTDLLLPLSSWTPLLTNQFNGSGSFFFTNPVNPAVPTRFYRLAVP